MRTTALLLFTGMLLIGCSTRQKDPAMDHTRLVQTYFEHFNAHRWKEMAAMYTDSAEFLDPSFGPHPVRQTRAQVEEKYAGLAQTFPDLRDDVQQILPSGDRFVTVQFISRGTAPDGSAFELPICTVFTIENGLITRDHTYYDNMEEPKDH